MLATHLEEAPVPRAPAASSLPALRRLVLAALAFAALFAAGWLRTAAQGVIHTDEAALLQVATRVVSGEVLYRDVCYNPTPLAIHLTAAAVALFGSEIAVLRAVDTLVFAATALLVAATARRLGAGWLPTLLVGLAMLWFDPPGRIGPGSVYTALAIFFQMLALELVLTWRRGRPDGSPRRQTLLLAALGAAAGLAFLSKQNVGVFALAAALGSLAIDASHGRGWLRALVLDPLLVLAAFALVAGLGLLPVWWQGAWPRFLDYAFQSQGAYVRVSRLDYFAEARELPSLYLLGPAAALLLAALLLRDLVTRDPRWPTTAAVMFFLLAGFLAIFPRPDVYHVAAAVPTSLAALAWAAVRFSALLSPRCHAARAVVGLAGAGWLAVVLTLALGQPLLRWRQGGYHVCDLPHCRGVWLYPRVHASLESNARALRSALPPRAAVHLVGPECAIYYLAADLRNPTPYDYPSSAGYGRHGEQDVLAALQRGDIPLAAIQDVPWTGGFAPIRPDILDRIPESLPRAGSHGGWTLYGTAPSALP